MNIFPSIFHYSCTNHKSCLLLIIFIEKILILRGEYVATVLRLSTWSASSNSFLMSSTKCRGPAPLVRRACSLPVWAELWMTCSAGHSPLPNLGASLTVRGHQYTGNGPHREEVRWCLAMKHWWGGLTMLSGGPCITVSRDHQVIAVPPL